MNKRQRYVFEVCTGTTGAAYFLNPNTGSVVTIDQRLAENRSDYAVING